jgi:hypothetical protein
MMDATDTIILVSIFALGALLIVVPRALDRRQRARSSAARNDSGTGR